jgi:hypothetical protein
MEAVNDTTGEHRDALVAFYQEHDPSRVANVDNLLREHPVTDLALCIRQKYGVLPVGWEAHTAEHDLADSITEVQTEIAAAAAEEDFEQVAQLAAELRELKAQDPMTMLEDPMVQQILLDLQENPSAAQHHLQNADAVDKINRLVAAGVLAVDDVAVQPAAQETEDAEGSDADAEVITHLVHVHRAKKLDRLQVLGHEAPYAVITSFPSRRCCRQTSSSSGRFPEWGEDHNNRVELHVPAADTHILLEVWNWNALIEDELFGSTLIPLSDIDRSISTPKPTWYDLDSGQVQVTAQRYTPAAAGSVEEREFGVEVFRAERLFDSQLFGSQNPYVIATLMPSGTNARARTHVAGGVNPQWEDDSLIVLGFRSNDQTLRIELWNENSVLLPDDLIGHAELPVNKRLVRKKYRLPISSGGRLECAIGPVGRDEHGEPYIRGGRLFSVRKKPKEAAEAAEEESAHSRRYTAADQGKLQAAIKEQGGGGDDAVAREAEEEARLAGGGVDGGGAAEAAGAAGVEVAQAKAKAKAEELARLTAAKAAAVEAEDYDEAKRLKVLIDDAAAAAAADALGAPPAAAAPPAIAIVPDHAAEVTRVMEEAQEEAQVASKAAVAAAQSTQYYASSASQDAGQIAALVEASQDMRRASLRAEACAAILAAAGEGDGAGS